MIVRIFLSGHQHPAQVVPAVMKRGANRHLVSFCFRDHAQGVITAATGTTVAKRGKRDLKA